MAVAPVGLALERALAARPDLAMLGPDAEHQSAEGSYLAAATIYATMFDRDPQGLAYRHRPISEDDAAFFQRIARETLDEWQAGPEQVTE